MALKNQINQLKKKDQVELLSAEYVLTPEMAQLLIKKMEAVAMVSSGESVLHTPKTLPWAYIIHTESIANA